MKHYQIDFSRSEKSPQIIERELNQILDRGALKWAVHSEGPSGRLHYSLFINEEGNPNAMCVLVREVDVEKTQTKVNSLLCEHELLMPLQIIGAQSNNIFTTLFLKRKTESASAPSKG